MQKSFLRKVSFLCGLFISIAVAWSASDPRLDQFFAESFESLYAANHCGDNIMSFVRQASARRILSPQSNILHIFNRGGTELDPVWGLKARGARGEKRQRWMFHVVLESNGYIYDFDFQNQPRPLPTHQYFLEMFIELNGQPRPVFFSDPLKDYMIQKIPTWDYLNDSAPDSEYPKRTLEQFLSETTTTE